MLKNPKKVCKYHKMLNISILESFENEYKTQYHFVDQFEENSTKIYNVVNIS